MAFKFEVTQRGGLRGLLEEHSRTNPPLKAAYPWSCEPNGETIATDFDGVAHHYETWTGPKATGDPIEGIARAYATIKDSGYRHVVFTTRPKENVIDWLEEHGLLPLVDEVISGKPMYVAFFDDRAWNVPSNQPNGLYDAVTDWLWERKWEKEHGRNTR